MQRFVLGVILAALLSAPVASAQSRTHNATPAMKADESRSTGESGTEIKDSWLTTKTKAKLFADRHVKGRKISVDTRSEEHTSELQSHSDLVCRLLLEKKKKIIKK